MSITGYLIAALAAALAWGGFATERWLTSGERCKTSMARAAQIAVERERERAEKADRNATALFDDVKGEVRSSLQTADEAKAKRTASIRAAAVAGECRMPALPSLKDAVQEARDAAGD